MKISVIGSTCNGDKRVADISGGKAAAVCYMRDSFDVIRTEDIQKTDRRIELTKQSGHHSVYDHFQINLLCEDIPKLLAMVLNNENDYATSEKSGRYTKMTAESREKELYDKWLEIFKTKISEVYANEPYVMKAVEKLAQENARYMLSVLSPATTMVYTVSYRQLNLLYGFAKKMMEDTNALAVALRPSLTDFCGQLDATGFIDEQLAAKGQERGFSFIENDCRRAEVFGDVYCVNYRVSFAVMAHLHRHRTLYHSVSLPKQNEFYIPEIIRDDKKLSADWIKDMNSVADTFPNGMMLDVNERGTIEKFILKSKLRHCARVLLETHRNVFDVMQRYHDNGDARVKSILNPYLKMRCQFHDFKCGEPCAWADGIKGTRKI